MSLVHDLRLALDPLALMAELGLTPDPWQGRMLASENHRIILNCSRQSGKSTVAALLALHHALFKAPALVLLLSPSLRQSSELARKITDFWHLLDGTDGNGAESVLRLELRNGSRIISLPGSEATIRGYSGCSLLVVDEAARVSDDLITAVLPTLATVADARVVMLSTPWGKRGFFHHEWTFNMDGWERYKLTADECPRIGKEFLDEQRKQLGEFIYQQEYGCEFVDVETQMFSSELIEAALSDEVRPLWN